MTDKNDSFNSVAIDSESIGSAVGKLGIVWTGFLAGIKLGDLVLLATLIYTLLQIGILVAERIVKPYLAARVAKKLLPVTTDSQEK